METENNEGIFWLRKYNPEGSYRPLKTKISTQFKISEIISFVGKKVYMLENPEDSLKKVLTKFKIESKVKMNKNKFQ